ncbi:MAG: response regulator, partial [Actinobacteria bacterium]|nr:response regulator [Actinomycetota bacterium]
LEPMTPTQESSVREILAAADTIARALRELDGSAGGPPPAAPAVREQPVAPGTGTRPRVLVVEDDPAAGRIVERALQGAGADVVVARTCREALAVAHDVAPELVLLDLGLPDGDGRDVLRALRAVPALEQVTIVIVSGQGGASVARELVALGANIVLSKPVEIATLRALLPPLDASSSSS